MVDHGEAVQIFTCENHRFELQLDKLQQILDVDDLKDRSIVAVSIAGSFRTGKSFLLNFFVKYLRAQVSSINIFVHFLDIFILRVSFVCASQYKTHNLANWIGSNVQQGFEWRGGKTAETNGIWIWSEIFTHNFDNGDKVAIILLDTQGIFDHTSSMKECVSIFAISMLVSSVFCNNVMQNVEEDKLQHLQFFLSYASWAMKDSCTKAFHKLLFIVRDWPHVCDHQFGYSKNFIDDLLAERIEQTQDMRELRKQLRESIDEINAFLMPYPEEMLRIGQQFMGDIDHIDSDFIDLVKVLVPSIFAPENLTVKRINGKTVCVDDFVASLETFLASQT